jgi:hypothetical protein
VEFTDGTIKEIDLDPYLRGPVFEDLRKDRAFFLDCQIDDRMKTIVWRNGADIDPDVLYHGLAPAWQEAETADIS